MTTKVKPIDYLILLTKNLVLSHDVVFDENRIGYHHVLENSTTHDDLFPSIASTLSHDSSHEPLDDKNDQIESAESFIPNSEPTIIDHDFPALLIHLALSLG
jgi:hypothetical protein